MTRPLAVLRPEPGNDATARRIEALGLAAHRLPLFATVPLAWTPPDPAGFDALVLTSATTVRQAGAGLEAYARLPVYAVGAATAAAARTRGFQVIATGADDADALIEQARRHGVTRALHLGGRDVAQAQDNGVIARHIAVYASDPLPIDAAALQALSGAVALVHSPRAGARLAGLIDAAGLPRAALRLAAISHRAAAAAGQGWAAIAIADQPSDAALIAAAHSLAD